MMGNLPPQNMDPVQAEMEKRRKYAEALNARGSLAMPQNIGQGLASIGDAIVARSEMQNAMFPAAPGGSQGDWATNFQNFFNVGKKGLF